MSNIPDKFPTCSTCVLCIEINCHPGNSKIGVGNMSDKLGYACLLFIEDNKPGVFLENNLGSCECHTIKEK